MKKLLIKMTAVCLFLLFTISVTQAQNPGKPASEDPKLKTYLIEREIPGAGKLTAEELKGISQKSCTVLKEMGPVIQWQHSYVTGDKVFCVYKAENEELLRQHAEKGGFPINKVTEIKTTISPETAK